MATVAREKSKKNPTVELSLLSKKFGMNVLLAVLMALLSSPTITGKYVVPFLKLMLMMLASQLQDSQKLQHSALFLLVNIIIFAIWISSCSIRHGFSSRQESTPLALPAPTSLPENASADRNSLPLPPDLSPQEEHQAPAWSGTLEMQSHIEIHPHSDRRPERQHGKERTKRLRVPQYPLVAVTHVQEINHTPVHPESIRPSKAVNREEESAGYLKDVEDGLSVEKIEAFIMRHHEQWRQQRQDSMRRTNKISWMRDH